jgi:hypothetical protein
MQNINQANVQQELFNKMRMNLPNYVMQMEKFVYEY